MGCGASRSYEYEVSQIWDSAHKTIERRPKKSNLVVKRLGWKTIRIFVSSTFKDFHAERDVLIKEVFPDLRAWCEKRRLHLVECDLRWGVPKDTTTEETLRTCLGEIDRCYSDNIMPFFLNMTSERCGWIPGGMEVPMSLAKEYRWVNGLSVTEMEIMHGAYRIDNPNCIFAIRDSSFLADIPADHKDDFVDCNPIAAHKLQMLKDMLKQRFPDGRVFKYTCKFAGIDVDSGKVSLDGLDDSFKTPIFEFFKERIAAQYPLDENIKLNPYETEKEEHESFMKSRSQIVLGRNEMLQKIEDYVQEVGAAPTPVILLGGPGSGKSSIMARVADVAVKRAVNNEIPGGGDQGWHVFYHFVGAVPGSTDVEKMLRRLLIELKVVNESIMPKDYEAAAQLTSGVLSNSNSRPTIVIIDALNQFDEGKGYSPLRWLPRKLAPQIRCVFSMINDTSPHRLLRERALKPNEIEVTPLDTNTRQEIVKESLGQYQKRLDQQQMSSLLSKDSSQNPLWLAIACEELRVYGDFSTVTDKINSLSDGLLDLLGQVLQRFEQENGGNLLVATMCLLECSSHGLLETELLAILGDEDNLMPPDEKGDSAEKGSKESSEKKQEKRPLAAAKWAAVYRALRTFLRPFGDSGAGRLDFYHRSLSKAVRQKYFGLQAGDGTDEGNPLCMWWHTKLADFFEHEQNLDRKVEEYPYQLVKIGDQDRLARCLIEWPVFDRLFEDDYSTELLAYWRKVGEYSKMHDCYKNSLQALSETLGISKEEIALRHENIGKIMVQAGLYQEAKPIIDVAIEIEQEHGGSRPERMAELTGLYGELYDEIAKMHDFITREQIKDLKPAIEFNRKSVKIRETLEGGKHKFKRGDTLMRLSFNLNTWMECGGDNNLSADEAKEESEQYIETAIEIFREIGDLGKEAEASMTKAILYERGSDEQLEYYLLSRDQCQQAYGDSCKLMTRIISNTGIYFEDKNDYYTAYEYFVKWYEVSKEVFGENHPKTKSAKSCLSEPRYQRIRQSMENGGQRGQPIVQDDDFQDDDDDDDDDEY
ncbi:TPR repeat-containing protein DDB_G0287407-like isoform X2 [Amphiura filiformis]|uniref:TPR repeat-containing protein DDB_G0287407-like isoform X2 n=1 Tax=Amphiura filiformis TaxID=82378 RepID=UPI003B226B78